MKKEIIINYPIYIFETCGAVKKIDKLYLNEETLRKEKVLVHDNYLNYECVDVNNEKLLSVLAHKPNCLECYGLLFFFLCNSLDVDFTVEELFKWGLTEVCSGTHILDVKTYLIKVLENYEYCFSSDGFDINDILDDSKKCIWND